MYVVEFTVHIPEQSNSEDITQVRKLFGPYKSAAKASSIAKSIDLALASSWLPVEYSYTFTTVAVRTLNHRITTGEYAMGIVEDAYRLAGSLIEDQAQEDADDIW